MEKLDEALAAYWGLRESLLDYYYSDPREIQKRSHQRAKEKKARDKFVSAIVPPRGVKMTPELKELMDYVKMSAGGAYSEWKSDTDYDYNLHGPDVQGRAKKKAQGLVRTWKKGPSAWHKLPRFVNSSMFAKLVKKALKSIGAK